MSSGIRSFILQSGKQGSLIRSTQKLHEWSKPLYVNEKQPFHG
jgi:hypothetical protein